MTFTHARCHYIQIVFDTHGSNFLIQFSVKKKQDKTKNNHNILCHEGEKFIERKVIFIIVYTNGNIWFNQDV